MAAGMGHTHGAVCDTGFHVGGGEGAGGGLGYE